MSSLKDIVKVAHKLKPFVGGLFVGSVGLKALTSKDAKKIYSNVIAKGYEVRDYIESTVDDVKQQSDDVLADAKTIYETNKKEEELDSFKQSQTN